MARKLGRTAEKRMAIIKNQASELLWNGHIDTTVDRAKEVKKYAEKMLTLAINSYEDVVTVTKTVKKDKTKKDSEKIEVQFVNDGPKKLAARRKLMAGLRDLKETKNDKEKKSDYKVRTADVKHPLIEKIFREYAPFYAKRAEECGQKGGYVSIVMLGFRRGDAAEMARMSLVKGTPDKK